ncbi:hypothetical protein M3I01_009825 [Marinomonas sp. RSW2]|uniref:Late embryogenesis abundant protein n=1 Tax=Marinomonas maritima TaxID=2940935 RepID=A0ABT5WEF8_9GAMM|nr:hypothetical protein [Marinomonas maritima]MDE8603208.1 hypothetical protein [Marinomonas maritima]
MMKYITVFIGSLILLSTLAQAEESTLDKAKDGALQLWDKTKKTTIEIADSTSEKASEVGDKASDFGNKASKNAKETGAVVWDKMKEVGAATAEGARNGASKIRKLVSTEDCKEDSALCYKDKE